jgi:hypothetical protein
VPPPGDFFHTSDSNTTCRYQTLLGCGNINLTNTTNLYARFTTTVICNAIIQNSRTVCDLSAADSRPVCADTCVCFAKRFPCLNRIKLTLHRHNKLRVRPSSSLIVLFAPIQAAMPIHKSEPISPIAPYRPIRYPVPA